MSDRATVLKINSVSAVGALSVIPAPLRHSCGGRNPCDRPTVRRAPSARRPTRAPSAPRMIGRRRTLGAPLTPQIAWIPACAGMTEPAAPEPARTYKGAAPRHHIHPRQRFETAPKCSPRGGAVAQRLRGRLPTPPACAVARPAPYLQLLPPRRPARNLHFPSPPASRGEMSDRATVLKINSVSAVGALSVIPAQAGIQATAQRCDELHPPDGPPEPPAHRA